MKEKKFVRFVCNTSAHSRGEKIKAVNVITKVYDDKDIFLYVKKPYITTQENQLEIDIEGTDYKGYMPLHHFKHDKGNIVKKSDAEIQDFENQMGLIKRQKLADRQKKDNDINDAKSILGDKNKTDKERLDALGEIINLKGGL